MKFHLNGNSIISKKRSIVLEQDILSRWTELAQKILGYCTLISCAVFLICYVVCGNVYFTEKNLLSLIQEEERSVVYIKEPVRRFYNPSTVTAVTPNGEVKFLVFSNIWGKVSVEKY